MGHDGLEVYVGKITPLHMAGAFHFCFINFSAVPLYSLPLLELFAVSALYLIVCLPPPRSWRLVHLLLPQLRLIYSYDALDYL